MLPSNPYSATGGYYGDDDPVEWGEDLCRDLTSSPPFPPPQEGCAWPDEQSIALGGQEISIYDPSFYLSPGQEPLDYEVSITGAAAETSASVEQSPTIDSCLSPHDSGIEAYHSHSAPAADSVYRRTEVGPPVPQQATHLLSILDTHIDSPDYADSDVLQPHRSPPVYHNQAEGQPQSSSLLSNRDKFCHTMTQVFSNSDYIYPTYPTATGSPPLLDYTIQATPVVIYGTDPSGYPGPSVSGPPWRKETEETTGLSTRSPQFETNSIESQNPRKRKGTWTEDESSEVDRTRLKRQQNLHPQQASVQAAQSQIGRPNLRRVQQRVYKCGNPQKGWTRFPDIDFRVKGVEGIRLSEAMDMYFDGPDGRDDLMFTNEEIGNSVSCRIIFEGHQQRSKTRQIVTMNHKRARVRITKKKLAHEIAKNVQSYLKELSEAGTPFHARFEDIFLTKFTHVARASWQPEIYYQITPSPDT